MQSDLPFTTLADLSRLLAAGQISSRLLVEACLSRIDALDARLHAFVEVYHEQALASAQAADIERRAGLVLGPLHGIPIALKDLLHLRGRVTTAGSKSWQGRIADHTATSVTCLLSAGMIALGKTHMVEFAFGGWGRNQPMGAPWNPWDPGTHRVAGGSSSGSAVAVAGGLAPAALGSDTGGSIRIPASLCGITGFKPTYGLVSLHGAVPLSTTLDSIGPLTRTVEDAALLLAAISGQDNADPSTFNAPRIDFGAALTGTADVRGMRIAVMPQSQVPDGVAPLVLRAYEQAVGLLRSLGATVEEARFPFELQDLSARIGRIIAAEAYAANRLAVDDEQLPIDPWVRKRTQAGREISAADYIIELRERNRQLVRFAEWMRGRDALLTPTLPITALRLEAVDEATAPLATFTRAANYLGACAVSLPAGFDGDGLPIGVQLIGAPFADVTLVTIGRAMQAASDWHLRRPPVAEVAPQPA